jgi:hypothetical protein
MGRKVFFSFHYQDVIDFRANVVRNSWLTKNKTNKIAFHDASIWEEAQLKGKKALENLINEGVKGSSVTTILTGSKTHSRRWVKYEVFRSFFKGNGILEVFINRIKSKKTRKVTARGKSVLESLKIEVSGDGKTLYLKELVNGKWQLFSLLPEINNRVANSLYFDKGYTKWFSSKESEWGRSYKLSELFPSYCWINDDGYNNFSNWVEKSAKQVNR